MPASRTRLRPWLEQKIESKSVPGLTWLDKENKMFAIPWKHAARHGWEMDRDACIFMQWAVHTGKFRPGVTDPDPKTWKANFRSALNSLPDIKQVKDKSINKGSEAVRVYRMLEEVPKKKDKKPKTTRKRKVKNVERDTKPDGQDSKDHLNHPGGQTTDTSNVSMQETKVDSTDELGLPVHHFGEEGEAVECSTTVEVIADSTNDFYGYFQVSPMNATDFDDEAAIIEMAQALEVDQTQWQETRADAPEMDAKHCIELKGLPGNTEDGDALEMVFWTGSGKKKMLLKIARLDPETRSARRVLTD